MKLRKIMIKNLPSCVVIYVKILSPKTIFLSLFNTRTISWNKLFFHLKEWFQEIKPFSKLFFLEIKNVFVAFFAEMNGIRKNIINLSISANLLTKKNEKKSLFVSFVKIMTEENRFTSKFY